MRKRSGKRTGRHTRKFDSTASSRRGKLTKSPTRSKWISYTAAARRGRKAVGRKTESERFEGNTVPGRRLDRGENLLAQGRAKRRRLSSGSVQVARRNENAYHKKDTSPKLGCARKKEIRRAVVIATGYGGRNNFVNYKRAQKCR